jgi:hypothetical protein
MRIVAINYSTCLLPPHPEHPERAAARAHGGEARAVGAGRVAAVRGARGGQDGAHVRLGGEHAGVRYCVTKLFIHSFPHYCRRNLHFQEPALLLQERSPGRNLEVTAERRREE